MFERYSDRAREAIVIAQDEARGLGHPFIGAEHLLLGALRVGATSALDADDVRAAAAAALGPGGEVPPQIPFTAAGQSALERARSLAGPRTVLPAHVVLALLETDEAVAIVERCGVAPADLRGELEAFVSDPTTDRRDPVEVTLGDDVIGDLGNPRTDVRLIGAILRRDGLAAGWLRTSGIDEAWVREFGGAP